MADDRTGLLLGFLVLLPHCRRHVGNAAADAERTRDGDRRGAAEDATEADRVGDLAAGDGVDAREAAVDGVDGVEGVDDAGRLAEAGG
ncbi:hypothetical protein [Streptomyces wuyuanensis]|uniref:hypothetical protein n=1 Tax=Streptomyces wuyuanensis TaxID=1196353 RepID=UPI003D7061AC